MKHNSKQKTDFSYEDKHRQAEDVKQKNWVWWIWQNVIP